MTRSSSPRRGDIVTVAGSGDYTGKPRPAVVVQSDLFNDVHGSLTVCLLTTTLVPAPLFRVAVAPSEQNGLRAASQIMVDKVASVRRDAIGENLGTLDASTMFQVDQALALWLGL